MAKIAIALGGNALGNDPKSEKEAVLLPAKQIVKLIKKGHDIIIGHGNGPQVGVIYNAFNKANTVDSTIPLMPFAESVAMSEGYIGYHIEVALANELKNANINKNVICVLTQTLVDKDDKAFSNPTKPVGVTYKTLKEAIEMSDEGSKFVEIPTKGFRKVVPSPKPINFLSIETIKNLFDKKELVIVGGGGGIPTIVDENGNYRGVDGVIDKDYVMSKIADLVDADILVILTNVDNVFVNFNKPNQKCLGKVTVSELEKYIVEKQFSAGSMLPKVEAAINFVKSGKNKKAIIAKLENLSSAIDEKSGTIIIKG